MQPEIGHHDAGAGWQEYADPLAGLRHVRDLAAQHEGGPDQARVGHRIAVDVLQNLLVAKFFSGGDQGIKYRFLNVTGVQGYAQVHPPYGRGCSASFFLMRSD